MDKALLDLNPFTQADIDRLTGKTGWEYKDFTKMPEKEWDTLLAVYGEGEYMFLTSVAVYTMKDGQVYKRAQLFVSQQGLSNHRFYNSIKSGTAFRFDPETW